VEPQRLDVLGVDRGDHDVYASKASAVKQRIDQRAADAPAPAVLANVDALLHRQAVARPLALAAKVLVRGEAQHIACFVGHQHRQPLRPLSLQPREALLPRYRLFSPRNRARRYPSVVEVG
jgi:hypothetical protein